MKSLLLALPLALAAAGSHAAETLLCDLRQYGPGNWIPDVVFIGWEEGADTATVSDPVVLSFNGAPVTAKIAADNAARLTFVWSLTVEDRSGTYVPSLIYRATYLKASGAMQISATAAGFDARFQGGGTCRREAR